MLNNRIKDIIHSVRDKAQEKGITAIFSYHYEKSHLLRIGNNSVSLSTGEELTRLDIEVKDGRKCGSHTQVGNITDIEYVEKALSIAVEKVKVAKPKEYDPIIEVVEENILEEDQFDEDLLNLDPEFKIDGYRKIFKEVGETYNFSGSWSSGYSERFIVTTANENEAFNRFSDQLFNIVLKHPEKKWELSESITGWEKDAFNTDSVIENLKKLIDIYDNNDGFKVDPGKYTIMFGPDAIAGIIRYAAFTGLDGRYYEEKQSWTANNKPGDRILGNNINLFDDPSCNKTFKYGFDMTGRKRENFPMVVEGVMENLLYDASTAAKYKRDPTGHDVGDLNMVFKAGDDPKPILEAAKGMGRVLYIPALHYLNLPNPNKGIFTGSSRFNALLIEDGKIISPILSSRITDTFQSVLNSVRKISSESVSVNLSNTYGRRSPVAYSVPSYIISEGIKITDCADSF